MPFSYSGGSRVRSAPVTTPPIELINPGINNAAIPLTSIGFMYWLLGAGGGGGSGGNAIGGGGGAAGELVSGRVLFAELLQYFGALSVADLRISPTLGSGGAGGVAAIGTNGNPGMLGGESILEISTSLVVPRSSIVLAVAKGGYSGLGGTQHQGWSPWEYGSTYTGGGGMGQLAERKEYRSRDGLDRRTTNLNPSGDGGDGGAIGLRGRDGLNGYVSIEFF